MSPKLLNGTDSTRVQAKEICAILEACRFSGVKSLKWGDLDIEFHSLRDQERVVLAESPIPSAEEAARLEDSQDTSLDFSNPNASTPEAKALMEEMHMAQLMTDDPVAYEQMQIDAHLDTKAVNHAEEEFG